MLPPTLVVLAAGMGSRYGGLKQIDPVGPCGEAILDYSVYDAKRAGFKRVLFVIRKDIEEVFREKVGSKYEGFIDVDYAFQDINDLPAQFKVPEARTKPWGTAHAIYSARKQISGCFAVINADDFYGREAFEHLYKHLSSEQPQDESASGLACGADIRPIAMVGYKLGNTLSDFGSVARGICTIDDGGKLKTVVEHTKLVKTADGAHDDDPAAEIKDFPADARVSMNVWGFSAMFLEALDERFPEWLEKNVNREKSEWYIPFVVDELIKEGKVTVQVLPTDSQWFGVTYREDKPLVVDSIRKLVDAGEYPECLFPQK